MKNILVPYDFSDFADHALNFAIEVADKSNGEITIFHVVEHPVTGTFNTTLELGATNVEDDIFTIELLKSTEKRMHEIAASKSNNSVIIKSQIRIGKAFESIAEEITKSKVDLVIMGTKGSSGLEEMLVGSNAEKVVRFGKCPVITIPEALKIDTIKNIAFATNFEDDQDKIIDVLKEYQKLFNARINLVWINTFQVNQNEDMIRNNLQETAQRNNLENYEIFTHMALKPEEGIVHFATQKNMDMIAMATHGHRGLLHLLIGSIAEDVVNHSPKPVWTLSTKSISK